MDLKYYIIPILLLLIIPNINAVGKVYNLNFDEENGVNKQIITVNEKDRVDFDLANGTHTIIASVIKFHPENLTKNRVELDIYRYINYKAGERPNIVYVTIHQGEQMNLDFDKDKYNDLNMRIINIKEGEATFLFTKLHECIFSDPKLCEKEEEIIKEEGFFSKVLNSIKNINKTGLIIFFSIIIIGLLLYFVFRKPKS